MPIRGRVVTPKITVRVREASNKGNELGDVAAMAIESHSMAERHAREIQALQKRVTALEERFGLKPT